jgi:hypothetical protein
MGTQVFAKADAAVDSELARQSEVLAARDKEFLDSARHFEAALANMAQGLCMFDDEMRVVAVVPAEPAGSASREG